MKWWLIPTVLFMVGAVLMYAADKQNRAQGLFAGAGKFIFGAAFCFAALCSTVAGYLAA